VYEEIINGHAADGVNIKLLYREKGCGDEKRACRVDSTGGLK
jgi:hypothetical protein